MPSHTFLRNNTDWCRALLVKPWKKSAFLSFVCVSFIVRTGNRSSASKTDSSQSLCLIRRLLTFSLWLLEFLNTYFYTYRRTQCKRKNNTNSHRCSLFDVIVFFYLEIFFVLLLSASSSSSSVYYYSVRNTFFDRYINNHCHITIDWNNYIFVFLQYFVASSSSLLSSYGRHIRKKVCLFEFDILIHELSTLVSIMGWRWGICGVRF